jgi:GGDEF domain-containing protein
MILIDQESAKDFDQLAEILSQISMASQASLNRLQELQVKIDRASLFEDLQSLKRNLTDCLDSIRGECCLRRDEADRAAAKLKESLQKTSLKEEPPELDPLTGLQMRSEAEAAIKTACGGAVHAYAGLFVIDRIQVITSRFGNEFADKILIFFVQQLSGALTPKDTLYRWGPTTFFAMLDRRESADHVRREMARTMTQRWEQTFEIGSRSVVLPVSSTWTVMPLFEQSYAETLHKLEAFSAAPRKI